MTRRLEGKGAFITGADFGQGQGRAFRLAREGAVIIAVDVFEHLDSDRRPLPVQAHRDERIRLIEALVQRMVARTGDDREPSQPAAALDPGLAELGRFDAVVANAGICPLGSDEPAQGFLGAATVDRVDAVNAVNAALTTPTTGASSVRTETVARLLESGTDDSANGRGGAGCSHARRGVARFVHDLALQVAPRVSRGNAVHPSSVNTVDQSNAVLFLASDESRHVTSLELAVDAGATQY